MKNQLSPQFQKRIINTEIDKSVVLSIDLANSDEEEDMRSTKNLDFNKSRARISPIYDSFEKKPNVI